MSELLEFDLSGINQLAEKFDPKVVDKALNRTLGRMQSKSRSLVSKDVRSYYNVPASRVKQDLSLRKVTEGGKPGRMLLWAGERIGLTRYSGKVKTVRIKATSSKGKTFSTRRKSAHFRVTRTGGQSRAQHKSGAWAFAGHGRNMNFHFFARNESGALESLKGPSVAHMVNKNTMVKVNRMLETDMPVEFNRNMNFYLGQKLGIS